MDEWCWSIHRDAFHSRTTQSSHSRWWSRRLTRKQSMSFIHFHNRWASSIKIFLLGKHEQFPCRDIHRILSECSLINELARIFGSFEKSYSLHWINKNTLCFLHSFLFIYSPLNKIFYELFLKWTFFFQFSLYLVTSSLFSLCTKRSHWRVPRIISSSRWPSRTFSSQPSSCLSQYTFL